MFKGLLRSDILVELPQSTDDVAVKTRGGLFVSTLAHKEKYNPTHGKVVQIADEVEKVAVGDTIFFGNHLWDVAKRRAFGDDDDRFKGFYTPDKVFAIKEGDGFDGSPLTCYMILPESMIYFVKRGEELIGMNGFVIAEPIQKEQQVTESKIVLVDLAEESYQENKFKVFLAPEGTEVDAGDIVHTLTHCDIVVEEELNAPILPSKYFFIEADDIIAKYEPSVG